MCGEKQCVRCFLLAAVGSPPRMRGKEALHHCQLRRQGITPAYAGKRPTTLPGWMPGGDHPRVCGEKQRELPVLGAGVGSPPHVRGKAQSLFLSCCRTCRDHPRMCGEKKKDGAKQLSPAGSPPHVRGKEHAVLETAVLPLDHPRMCGEKRPCRQRSKTR